MKDVVYQIRTLEDFNVYWILIFVSLPLSTVLGTEWLCSKCWWKESLSVYAQILKQMCSWHMGDTFCLRDNWQLSLLGSKSTQLKTKHSCLSSSSFPSLCITTQSHMLYNAFRCK